MIQTARVEEFMARELMVVRPNTEIHEAVALMLDRRVSGLPVVDEGGHLVGILTEQDCLRVAFQSHYHQAPAGTVANAMTSNPTTIDAQDDIMTAIDVFLRASFRRLPVLAGGTLVGVLSRRDALRVLRTQA
jgi:CBS domain-containing protein